MYAQEDTAAPDLREYLRILRRRKLAVVVTPLIAIAIALVITNTQTRLYRSSAELLFQSRPTEALFDPNTGVRLDPDRRLRNEIRVITSRPIRDAVEKRLGPGARIRATPVPSTDVINLSSESRRPRYAADVVNAYAEAYIEFRQQQAVDELFSAAQKVQEKLSVLQRQIDSAPEEQREELIKVQTAFREDLERLQLSADIRTAGAQLVTPASVPSEPFSPKPVRNVLTALVLGALLGIGIAFIVEHLDDTVKSKDDLDRASVGLPVLGLIPAVPNWKPKDAPQVVSLTDPTSSSSEAYRTLRTAVQFLSLDKPVRIVQVTSPNAKEGKTTTLVNLGVALARAGQRVVVICCDLRRPRVHEFVNVSKTLGFTSVLLGECGLADALHRVPSADRLLVLPAGPLPPNPSELLSSRRVSEVVTTLKSEGYWVLVDSPPVLPVTDALVVSRWVDATLLVSTAALTPRKDVTRAVELLRQVGAPLVGTVLNGVTGDSEYRYEYGNYRVEADEETNGATRSNRRRDRRWRKVGEKAVR